MWLASFLGAVAKRPPPCLRRKNGFHAAPDQNILSVRTLSAVGDTKVCDDHACGVVPPPPASQTTTSSDTLSATGFRIRINSLSSQAEISDGPSAAAVQAYRSPARALVDRRDRRRRADPRRRGLQGFCRYRPLRRQRHHRLSSEGFRRRADAGRRLQGRQAGRRATAGRPHHPHRLSHQTRPLDPRSIAQFRNAAGKSRI